MGEWVLKGGLTEDEAYEAYREKQKEKQQTGKYTQLDLSYIKDGKSDVFSYFKYVFNKTLRFSQKPSSKEQARVS